MSSAFDEQADSAPLPATGRTPLASVSRSALLRNATAAAALGARTYPDALLFAQAWGHGAQTVAQVLDEAGLTRSTPDAPSALRPEVLYGMPDAPGSTPAMRLAGTVLATKELRAGEGVSYGYRYRAPTDTRIALVTGGYAQGVVRSLGNVAHVTFADRRCRIVGRVAMDVCVVEIADAAVHRGDEAVFFGDPARGEPSLGEWQTATAMTAAELVTAVGLHAHREVTA